MDERVSDGSDAAALEDVEFLARSPHRVGVLDAHLEVAKRLELRPWTRYSVEYKEQIEREREQHHR